ncbi:hypothetical protein LOD99_11009 [Oopsacas minuta]|uniref:Transposase n=1 Tax=Oopsacas minuta TaxID=111878 RepID=A0AAV7KC06_9METZ|nr:hypothetical protein LOD99_11009 [Oopsacas minuta]
MIWSKSLHMEVDDCNQVNAFWNHGQFLQRNFDFQKWKFYEKVLVQDQVKLSSLSEWKLIEVQYMNGRSNSPRSQDHSPAGLCNVAPAGCQSEVTLLVDYKRLKAPARSTIMNIVTRIEEGGTVGNRKRKGPKKTVRTPENIKKIKMKLADSPHRATRRLSAEAAISRSSMRRILNDDIGAFPYKIQMQQKKSESNQKKKVQFVTYISKKIEEEILKITEVHWSDEANFHLSGHVNKQNMRFWALEKPESIAQRPLSTEKLGAWCAVAHDRIIGPYFFEDEDGKTCTVNRWRYLAMLNGFYLPNIRRHGELNTITFHQDGAPPHYANLVRGWL